VLPNARTENGLGRRIQRATLGTI